MTNEKIAKILNEHSVPFKIINKQIIADSMEGGTKLFEKTVNLTGIKVNELCQWLGY